MNEKMSKIIKSSRTSCPWCGKEIAIDIDISGKLMRQYVSVRDVLKDHPLWEAPDTVGFSKEVPDEKGE